MPLTPEDVANKQFTSTRLKPGYDETEVDEFLDEVEAELTRLYRENDELRSKLTNAQRQLAEGGGDSGSVQQAAPAPIPQPAPPPPPPPPPPPAPVPAPVQQAPAGASVSETATGILALAQRTADEHVSEARTQADRIIGEARTRADQLKREADDKHRQMIGSLENERVTLEREVEKLRTFEREYRSRLKSYLEGQLRELDVRATQAAGGPANPGGQPASSGQPGQAPRSPFSPGAPVGGNSAGQGQQAPTSFGIDEGGDRG
jgi:DivIVA domain-containing protein